MNPEMRLVKGFLANLCTSPGVSQRVNIVARDGPAPGCCSRLPPGDEETNVLSCGPRCKQPSLVTLGHARGIHGDAVEDDHQRAGRGSLPVAHEDVAGGQRSSRTCRRR